MKIEKITVTPELATEWLAKNKTNRRINELHLRFLVEEIVSGRWKCNGDAIRFDDAGNLLDGQHRLMAITRTGKPLEFVVVTGLDHNSFATMDVGKKRSWSDALSVLGEDNPILLASSAAACLKYLNNKIHWATRFSNQEIINFIEENPSLRSFVLEMSNKRAFLSPAIAVACKFLFSQKDKGAANIFFDKLYSGANLEETDPVYILRERLLENYSASKKMSGGAVMGIVIKAWNAKRSGTPIKRLRFSISSHRKERQGEAFPEIL